MKKYFHSVMFKDETIALLTKDGLAYVFNEEDIKEKLIEKFIPADNGNFYFNFSRDRYCAEYNGVERAYLVNPSAVHLLFGEPVLIGEEV